MRPVFRLLYIRDNAKGAAGWKAWLLEARLHHWLKNILLFAPLALTPELLSLQTFTACVIGFLLLSITCSGTYLLNDVFDMEADQVHWSKCERPVASGRVSVFAALLTGVGLSAFGVLAAIALNGMFALFLGIYVLLSLSYSYRLKSIALLDLAVLASLFTLRIIMGIVLIGVALTPWLPLFAFAFFGGLSAAKRTAELVRRIQRGDHSNNRRGYLDADLKLLVTVGAACSIGALLILSIYIFSVLVPEALFQSSERLWFSVPLLAVWVLRIWLLAVRGQLDDDPLLYSITDRFSLLVAALMAAVLVVIQLA